MNRLFTMTFSRRILFALFCYITLETTFCSAISIEVVDQRGDPIIDAEIAIVNNETKRQTTVESNAKGLAEAYVEKEQSVTILCAHPKYKGYVRETVKSEDIRIRLKSVNGIGSKILAKMPAELPGLTGRLTILMDQTDQLYIYGERMEINEQSGKLLPWRIKKPLHIEDSRQNQADVSIINVCAGLALIDIKQDPREPTIENLADGTHFLVQDRRGNPVAKAEVVLLLVRNNTFTKGVTNELGEVSLSGFPNEPAVIYCGHEAYRAFREVTQSPYGSHTIRLVQSDGIGSVVFESNTGYINGLEGRINPILDNFGRLYMYATNIALEGGKQQPIKFELGRVIAAEDAQGTRCNLVVLDIKGDSSLLEYQFQ